MQYGEDKCHKLHIGRKLYIDTWKVKAVRQVNTNKFDLEDEESSGTLVDISEEVKYLGDILSSDSKNSKNILARSGKGQGIIKRMFWPLLPWGSSDVLDLITFEQ